MPALISLQKQNSGQIEYGLRDKRRKNEWSIVPIMVREKGGDNAENKNKSKMPPPSTLSAFVIGRVHAGERSFGKQACLGTWSTMTLGLMIPKHVSPHRTATNVGCLSPAHNEQKKSLLSICEKSSWGQQC